RVGRWQGPVLEIPRAHDQWVGVGPGGEEHCTPVISAPFIVTAQLQQRLRALGLQLDPTRLTGELAETSRAVDPPRVVCRQRQVPCVVTLKAPQPTSRLAPQASEEHLGNVLRSLGP